MTVSISAGAKNVEDSLRAGRIVRAMRRQCYANACHVIQEVPGYQDEDYVEGLAVLDGGLLIEHGWGERRDGQVIDPTPPETPATYFAGLRFRGQHALAEVFLIPKPERTPEDLPIFWRRGGQRQCGFRKSQARGDGRSAWAGP